MRPFAPFVDGYWDVENQLAQHIQRRASAAAALEHAAKCKIATTDEFERRRHQIRQAFMEGIGGLPTTDAPLSPEITGVIQKDGYSVEKVIYESLPQFFVTANLYLPKGAKSLPAILFLCGHAREAKAYPVYQNVCIALVRAGFVVLAVDPLGQGERMGYVNPKTRKLDVEWGTYEHSHAGLQCTLRGHNIARYFIYDAMRSLDYLCSRPEVDPNRIGVTGNSGGGTQTSYLMMADERIKVAIPCTYITAREHYLWTGQAHDAEQNIFGAFTKGINYDDLLISIAPRPVQLGAVASDFFTIEGAIQSASRARHVYNLYGKPQNFRLVIADGTHQYADLLREETVRWFLHHLQDNDGKADGSPLGDVIAPNHYERPWRGIVEVQLQPSSGESATPPHDPNLEEHDLLPERELWCTSQGQIALDYPESETVFDLNRKAWAKEAKTSAPFELLQQLVCGSRDANPIWVRCIESGTSQNLTWKKVFFFTESDVAVTGIWVMADTNAPPWVVLLEEGTNAVQKSPELVRELAKDKGNILLFDVRGHGATSQRPVNRYRPYATYGTEFVLNYNAIMLEDSLLWMRAYDVVEALIYACGVTKKRPSLYAEGWLAVVGLAAAAAVEKVNLLAIAPEVAQASSKPLHQEMAATKPEYAQHGEGHNGVHSLEFDRLLYDVSSIINERFHQRDHRLEAFRLAHVLDIQRLIQHFGHRATVHAWVDGRGRRVDM